MHSRHVRMPTQRPLSIRNTHLLTTPTTPLVLYLPPIGVNLQHVYAPRVPRLLFDTNSSSTLNELPIAQINYRWNVPQGTSPGASPGVSNSPNLATHGFPTPLHDTLHAYTWLTTSFLPSFIPNSSDPSPLRSPSPYASAFSQAARRKHVRPLLIYGSFLGGTLASSLSLTETQIRPVTSSIEGVIVRNGVFDWSQVVTSRPSSALNRLPATDEIATGRDVWDIAALHTLKTHLFTSPASAFDPFASPVLFFRSPGLSVPSYFPGTTPSALPPKPDDPALLDGLSISEEELASLRARTSNSSGSTPENQSDEEVAVSRRSALRFPPKDSGLRIPHSLFLTTSRSLSAVKAVSKKRGRAKAGQSLQEEMNKQAEEMAKLMRRSLVMYEFKDRALWDGDGDPHALSEERVQVHELGVDESEQKEAAVVEGWLEGLGLGRAIN